MMSIHLFLVIPRRSQFDKWIMWCNLRKYKLIFKHMHTLIIPGKTLNNVLILRMHVLTFKNYQAPFQSWILNQIIKVAKTSTRSNILNVLRVKCSRLYVLIYITTSTVTVRCVELCCAALWCAVVRCGALWASLGCAALFKPAPDACKGPLSLRARHDF